MNVLFRSDAGPLEGFVSATFRVAINDDGIGSVTGDPRTIDGIDGPIVCEISGVPVFVWTPEESERTSADADAVTINGRGRTAALERAIVLPVGYPDFTERTRVATGAPFGIWADLLAEAQARGRAVDLTPTFTATTDSNGVPWKETIDIQLEPGTTLRSLLDNVTEVEVAEWVLRPGGDLDAATFLGVDRSTEVVLFVGQHQIERRRQTSAREQRQTVFIEASTGVSQADNALDTDFGELWLEAQDYADVVSRQGLADKLAEKLADQQEEVDVTVTPDCGVFDTFTVGDRIGLDDGSGEIRTVRVVGVTIAVTDVVNVELTLVSEVALRQQRIDRAIEAKADVRLAASPSIQRRHGLVTADKFLSGAVGDEVAIASTNYDPGVDGWLILGNGNAEFNDVVIRGDLESNNYVEGVSGWRLDQDGDAELNDATIRGDLQSDNYDPGVAGWTLLRTGFAEFEEGLFRGDIVGSDITGSDIVGSTFATAAAGAGVHRILISQQGTVGALRFFDPGGQQFGALDGLAQQGLNRVALTSEGNIIVVSQGTTTITTSDWSIGSNGIASFSSMTADFVRSNGGARVVGQLNVDSNVISGGIVQADGSGSFGGLGFFGGQLSVNGNANLNNTVNIAGDTNFRTTQSGQFFRMNQAGSGSQGGEPTLDTTSDQFGFVGIPGRRMFRMHAGAFLTSSESRLKGELVDADLARCYDAVRSMRLTSYALHRDRDDYYGAKGEWLLGDRDDFVDRGGPLRKLGIVAEEAPDDVADEQHQNVDVYAYASLIAGAVKALQERVEAIEDDRGDTDAG